MFALINNIPAGLLKERVYVAVDFSQGDLYTEYVIKSLDAFHHANIIIETNISKDTDIFVWYLFAICKATPINLGRSTYPRRLD